MLCERQGPPGAGVFSSFFLPVPWEALDNDRSRERGTSEVGGPVRSLRICGGKERASLNPFGPGLSWWQRKRMCGPCQTQGAPATAPLSRLMCKADGKQQQQGLRRRAVGPSKQGVDSPGHRQWGNRTAAWQGPQRRQPTLQYTTEHIPAIPQHTPKPCPDPLPVELQPAASGRAVPGRTPSAGPCCSLACPCERLLFPCRFTEAQQVGTVGVAWAGDPVLTQASPGLPSVKKGGLERPGGRTTAGHISPPRQSSRRCGTNCHADGTPGARETRALDVTVRTAPRRGSSPALPGLEQEPS